MKDTKVSLSAPRTVWVSEAERIASFHHVDGFVQRDFRCAEFFFDFLQDLTNHGYRFQ